MAGSGSSKKVVYAALLGNLLVAVTKAVAALKTGSSAMMSEAIHSFVDTGNEVLLLYGLHRSARPPDRQHPLGHGRELYFWSFIVALLIFALGAGLSIYEGITHLQDPEPITDPSVNYIVLALAFVFESVTWVVALRQFNRARGSLGIYEAFRRSKDPPSFMVLFEDSAALLGIVIAAVGTFISVSFATPVADGIASIMIGVLLAATAILLTRESKSLLIGEKADPALTESILRIAESKKVARANGVITVQLGPEQIVAALSVEFEDDLRATDIEEQVVEMEADLRREHPEIVALFIKPQTKRTFREAVRTRFGRPE